MKRIDAENLLGGHATGTLTEAERQTLFAAALEHQAVFDALMDEEALRELLADPAARAQLLAALAPSERPRVVPFWRRTGVLGAAATLIVAATAGLAYLRSPDAGRTPALQEQTPAPKSEPKPALKSAPESAPKSGMTPAVATASEPSQAPKPRPEAARTRALPGEPAAPPAPPAAMAAGLASDAVLREEAAREKVADARRVEAQDRLARKAEAPRPVPVVAGLIGGAAPAQVPAAAPAPGTAAEAASPAKKLKAARAVTSQEASLPAEPTWTLEPLPDGRTRVTVIAPGRPQPLLLKRGAAGIVVVRPQIDPGARGAAPVWVAQVRLAVGDTLDLYLLDTPVADPARLPETGPVDGYRARIHPPAKKGPER